LIVQYSKSFLYFCEDCGAFCEGEWVQHRQLDEHNGLVGLSLIGHSSLARLNGFDGLISLVDFIGLNVPLALLASLAAMALPSTLALSAS
jgi:hypothetical protein